MFYKAFSVKWHYFFCYIVALGYRSFLPSFHLTNIDCVIHPFMLGPYIIFPKRSCIRICVLNGSNKWQAFQQSCPLKICSREIDITIYDINAAKREGEHTKYVKDPGAQLARVWGCDNPKSSEFVAKWLAYLDDSIPV